MESRKERIASIYREESGRVLARLIRLFGGDFDVAEEALHEAFEAALAQWPAEGIPETPRAWLLRTARNKARKSRVRSFLRKVEEAVKSGDKAAAQEAFRAAQPELQRAATKGVVHANTVARKLSRLSARVKSVGA